MAAHTVKEVNDHSGTTFTTGNEFTRTATGTPHRGDCRVQGLQVASYTFYECLMVHTRLFNPLLDKLLEARAMVGTSGTYLLCPVYEEAMRVLDRRWTHPKLPGGQSCLREFPGPARGLAGRGRAEGRFCQPKHEPVILRSCRSIGESQSDEDMYEYKEEAINCVRMPRLGRRPYRGMVSTAPEARMSSWRKGATFVSLQTAGVRYSASRDY